MTTYKYYLYPTYYMYNIATQDTTLIIAEVLHQYEFKVNTASANYGFSAGRYVTFLRER